MLDQAERKAVITTLGRICVRNPERARLLADRLLEAPERYGSEALEVAVELGDPVSDAIVAALRVDDPRADRLATHLEPRLPWPTLTLRMAALTVMERVVDHARIHRNLPSQEMAAKLIDLANRQREVGRVADSIRASEEALAVYENSGQEQADLGHVMGLLTNMVIALQDAGQMERSKVVADRALGILQGSTRPHGDPKSVAHRARIISSGALTRHSLGDTHGAIEDTRHALCIFSDLVEQGFFSFRAEIARCFVNLSTFLGSLSEKDGAYAAAVKAVEFAGLAMEAEPDRAIPDMALALDTLASHQRNLGLPREALATSAEALALYETVTKRGVYAHARRYAAALNNHAVYLSDANAVDDHSRLTARAVQVLEQVERDMPGAAIDELATAHLNHALTLLSEDLAAQATATLREAIRLFDTSTAPGAKLKAAAAVSNLSIARREVGDEEGAAAARVEAINRLRALSETEAAVVPGVADAIRSECDSSDAS
jgi:hypothetical protein